MDMHTYYTKFLRAYVQILMLSRIYGCTFRVCLSRDVYSEMCVSCLYSQLSVRVRVVK